MARISSYAKDTSPNDNDLLVGSEYLNTTNGIDNFDTKSYKLRDLATYFANYQQSDGSSYSLATFDTSISTNATDIGASAAKITKLGASFGVMGADGTMSSFSEAFANQVLSVATSAEYASAAQLTALTSTVTTNGNGITGNTSSISTANTNISTNATAITASASDITTLTSTVNTQGVTLAGHTTSIATASSGITTNATNVSANASSVTTLTTNLNLKPDVFRQDEPPVVTNAVGSIWYDTDDSNKVYILVAGDPRVWTESTDGRIVTNINSLATANTAITVNSDAVSAEAAKITELQTEFTYTGDNITGINGSGSLNTAIDTARSTAESASATKVDTLGAKFFTNYNNATGAGTLTEAFANSVFTTTSNTDFATSSDVTSLTTTVASKPLTFRQAAQPSAVNPTGSIWFDSDDNNKIYILIAGSPKVWTATFDGRIASNTTSIGTANTAIGTNSTNISSNATATTNLTTTVTSNKTAQDAIPQIFRQDDAPAVTGPVKSLWYDTNDSNKLYVLEAGDPKVWTLTIDPRPVANATNIASNVTSIGLTPKVFRQAAAPAVTEPVSSIWYDSDANNIPYVLTSGSPNAWTAVPDSRVGTLVTGLANANTAISANSDNVSANATNITELESVFTFSGDDIDGVTGALNVSIDNAASTAAGSVATALDKLEAVFTQNAAGAVTGTTGVLSTAVTSSANAAITNASLASAADVTELKTQFSYNASGAIDGLDDTLSTTVAAAETNAVSTANTAAASKVANLASAFFTGYDPSDASYTGVTEAFSNSIVNTETATAYASASSVTALGTTVGGHTTSIATNVSSISGIEGKYGVTIDSNGALTGFGLIGGGGASIFKINANDFKIYNSGGDLNPFSVSGSKVQINADLTVTGTALIQGSFGSGDYIACKFKNTNTANAYGAGISLNSSSDYHHRILMTGGTTTNANTANAFDLSASYQLGEDGQYSKQIMKLNGAGLIIPNQTANGVTASANYASGMNIIFNENNGSRTAVSGRLHVNEYMRTFFLDVPEAPRTDGDYPNISFAIRKFVTASPTNYESKILWVKSSTNSLHVKGDIVASESSDIRLKDNIKPIEDALGKIDKIGGYEFDWNDKQELYEGHDVGVIAQEIEAVLPEVVETREDGYKAVDYKKIVPLLIQAIKEQQKQIDELKNK